MSVVTGRPTGPKPIQLIIQILTLLGIIFIIRTLLNIENDLENKRDQLQSTGNLQNTANDRG